ncbi:unnamed protein product [Durusdinium trenchii]|uniref:Uncharacterized protein n=2 Tax=Durusdinium trenchii TaxID=1381693 RepID=A0ABP0HFI6_9DINO
MNGMDRVRKVVYEFNFAGLGGDGPGGGLATMKMLRQIQRAPEKMVPLFKKNPEAFIMEVIRTQGGGGAGVGPWVVQKTRNHTLGTGKVLTEYAGNYANTIALHANFDPSVFGGPDRDQEYAMKFSPGRENADRMLNFVAELREIRKCPNVTGCEAAPRFCLGTFILNLRRNEKLQSALRLEDKGQASTAMMLFITRHQSK